MIEAGAVHEVISSRLRDIEQIAVGVVLVLLAPGSAPVVEDLAAKQPPGVPVTARHHHLLTHLHRVEIDDLEGDVIDLGLLCPDMIASVCKPDAADQFERARLCSC